MQIVHFPAQFPHTGRFRDLSAVIYGRSEASSFYRLAVRVTGKRVVQSFQTFAEAKREAAGGDAG